MTASNSAPEPTEASNQKPTSKGAPTPSRAQQEAARKRPLVPSDRKAAARAAREQQAAARERARIGMASGDERYLPVRERGPQKKYVRDYVDARFSIAELVIPLMVVVIFGQLIPDINLQVIITLAMWAFLLLAVIDVIVITQLLRRRLAAKYGKGNVEKIGWYTFMRAIQLRPLRLPKPQIGRGQFPE
ncbi:MAG TPA: DUF3043 domain-containing protein [Candidatus Lumbricidophila sp.]|nr:DUF3043 domain-containing protein [Candidatus Lumbricidophila sp.]